MHILAIDPGYTTGFCGVEVEDGFEVLLSEETSYATTFKAFHDLLHGMYVLPDKGIPLVPEIVICENFRLMPHKALTQIGKVFPSARLIGALEYIMWSQGLEGPVLLEPSVKARVKILPEHSQIVSGSEHKKDAYQLARYYYVTKLR